MSSPPNSLHPSAEPVSLSKLDSVVLDEFYGTHFAMGSKVCLGSAAFQKRKLMEYHDYLALAQVSGRIEPLAARLEDSFKIHFILRAPVPTMDAAGNLRVFEMAHLQLEYREEALRAPQPGHSFIYVVKPRGVWLPNVAAVEDLPPRVPFPPLCLGQKLPPRIRVRELILLAFGALTGQSIQMNVFDPAGVMNLKAADWWQRNPERLPLTRDPFVIPKT